MSYDSSSQEAPLAVDDGEERTLLSHEENRNIQCNPTADRRTNKGLKVAAAIGIVGLVGGVGGAIAYGASHPDSSDNDNSTFTNTTFNDTAPLRQLAGSGSFFPPVRERLGTVSQDTTQRNTTASMLGLAAVPFGGLILMLLFIYVLYKKFSENSSENARKNFDV